MNKLRSITAIIALSLLTGCGAAELPQNMDSHTDVLATESYSDTNGTESGTDAQNTEGENSAQLPEISPPAVTAEFKEEYEHMPLEQKPYQSPDISAVSEYFVHKKVGSALDMDIYLELIDKETDGLYCTVKNNKNVWREVVLKAYTEYDTNVDISTAESFAVAPNDEVVVKLVLNAEEYDKIEDLGFSFFCNGMNYSPSEKTANIREKEQEKDLSFILWLYYSQEAALWGGGDSPNIDLSESFVRGFNTYTGS